jgi:SAM-dependent methyltransferase
VTYWRGAADDEAMQHEHAFIWNAMLDTVDVDLAKKRVLDIGCNQGGFLRLLVDRCGIAAGLGYDPASGAIEDARRLAGNRPLRFVTADSVPAGWDGFDAAFSHEVLYLIGDLCAHARAVFRALVDGGVYYAVMGVHSRSPLMAAWHAENRAALGLPDLCDIDDVIDAFRAVGFDVSLGRLAVRFVPVGPRRHHAPGRALDWLDYYADEKVLLRFERPA